MRWTKEEVEKCMSLIKELGGVKLVAEILGRTEKAVNLKMNRLDVNIRELYFIPQNKYCLNCGEPLKRTPDFSVRKYCNQHCFGTHSGKNRIQSNETKNKISKTLIGKRSPNWKGVILERVCKMCKIKNVKKKKIICEDCRLQYYKFYRPSCEFRFNINDYIGYLTWKN